MDISTAVRLAFDSGRCIALKAFPEIRIRPTNERGNCIVMNADGSHPSKYGWQPTAEDLMRDDWIVVD